MSYKFIPTRVHGVLDYIVAIALVLAPVIFNFSDVGGAAVAVPMVLGIGLFLYSLFTRYELGIFKLIPMVIHLVIDVVASIVLIASPFVFGFIDQSVNAWLPHIVVGIAVILVVIFTQTVPREQDVA